MERFLLWKIKEAATAQLLLSCGCLHLHHWSQRVANHPVTQHWPPDCGSRQTWEAASSSRDLILSPVVNETNNVWAGGGKKTKSVLAERRWCHRPARKWRSSFIKFEKQYMKAAASRLFLVSVSAAISTSCLINSSKQSRLRLEHRLKFSGGQIQFAFGVFCGSVPFRRTVFKSLEDGWRDATR